MKPNFDISRLCLASHSVPLYLYLYLVQCHLCFQSFPDCGFRSLYLYFLIVFTIFSDGAWLPTACICICIWFNVTCISFFPDCAWLPTAAWWSARPQYLLCRQVIGHDDDCQDDDDDEDEDDDGGGSGGGGGGGWPDGPLCCHGVSFKFSW